MSDRKRRTRFTRAARARTGYFVGLLLLAAGLGLALAVGWGLVAAGVGLAGYFVVLYDVDEPAPDDDGLGVRLR